MPPLRAKPVRRKINSSKAVSENGYAPSRPEPDRASRAFFASPIASSQAPIKMGFKAGTTVTLENALAMMMVKSANDMAAVIAEGVSGSIEKFADEMNKN